MSTRLVDGPYILRWFVHAHLPPALDAVVAPFEALALDLVRQGIAGTAEGEVALRKLLEAKDAAVRARLEIGERPSAEVIGTGKQA